MVTVSVVGATGYAGVELVRLLSGHPRVRVVQVTSESQSGQPLGHAYPHLGRWGEAVLVPAAEAAGGAEVALLALPPGAAMALAPRLLAAGVRVIDLGADFRLRSPEAYREWYGREHAAPGLLPEAVYGLTELRRAELAGARLVANPGCYPTAALLALVPALKLGLARPEGIVVDAKSGVSGAGRTPSLQVHFGEVNENVRPYALAGRHRHTPEMEQELSRLAGTEAAVSFSPHLVPMTRGILATCYLPLAQPLEPEAAVAAYREFYRDEPFVHVLDPGRWPETKWTLGSNHCFLGLGVDRRAGRLVVCAALDNLGKGAAGQAVQNLNAMMGWPETEGLDFPALYP